MKDGGIEELLRRDHQNARSCTASATPAKPWAKRPGINPSDDEPEERDGKPQQKAASTPV